MAIGAFGQLVKELRIGSGKTLRAFCIESGIDPGNHSKLERGRLAPPDSDDKLAELASALGVKKGSQNWQRLVDLAAAEKGRIPGDLMDDAELVAKLPILFRTLRGEPADDTTLREIVKKVRET